MYRKALILASACSLSLLWSAAALRGADGMPACVAAHEEMPEAPSSCDPQQDRTEIAVPGACKDPDRKVSHCTDKYGRTKITVHTIVSQKDRDGNCIWQKAPGGGGDSIEVDDCSNQ